MQGVCACCAQSRPQKELQRVDFVPKAHPLPPQWLAWSPEEWERFGTLWWESIDEHLNILTYLRKYFHSEERLSEAQAEVDVAKSKKEEDPDNTDLQQKFADAQRWQTRVLLWQTRVQDITLLKKRNFMGYSYLHISLQLAIFRDF